MLGGLKAARRKVRLTLEALTRSYYLDDERKLPLVIEPCISDPDPVAWAESHSEFIASELARHGALLLHGFDMTSVERLAIYTSNVRRRIAISRAFVAAQPGKGKHIYVN
jgi:hypothetical protein